MSEQLSILVVDDEYDLADLLAELLAERGHRVTTAINGMLGMALMMSKEFDLVISDFMMPVMDGLEMVKGMRVEPRLASVPVIMMSAQIETVRAAGNGLVQALIQKPFRPKTLFAVIAEVVQWEYYNVTGFHGATTPVHVIRHGWACAAGSSSS